MSRKTELDRLVKARTSYDQHDIAFRIAVRQANTAGYSLRTIAETLTAHGFPMSHTAVARIVNAESARAVGGSV